MRAACARDLLALTEQERHALVGECGQPRQPSVIESRRIVVRHVLVQERGADAGDNDGPGRFVRLQPLDQLVELESCESAGNEYPIEYVLTALMKLPGQARNRVRVEAIIAADVYDGALFTGRLGGVMQGDG